MATDVILPERKPAARHGSVKRRRGLSTVGGNPSLSLLEDLCTDVTWVSRRSARQEAVQLSHFGQALGLVSNCYMNECQPRFRAYAEIFRASHAGVSCHTGVLLKC